jgi:cyanophycinase-like exopeptidase
VAEIIRQAEVVFIAGGDQSRYVNFWKGTPVQDAMNKNIAEGKPIGGTSAGLAIQAEFSYACLKDKPDDADLKSSDVLPDPFHERVTLERDFLKIPHLEGKITDSHFAKRDRLGRTLVFLARLMQDGWSKDPRDIAIDEKSAFLVEADGKGVVVGPGKGVYFIRPTEAPKVCREKTPLTFGKLEVYHAPQGSHFDLDKWSGQGGASYSLAVENGVVSSTQAGKSNY